MRVYSWLDVIGGVVCMRRACMPRFFFSSYLWSSSWTSDTHEKAGPFHTCISNPTFHSSGRQWIEFIEAFYSTKAKLFVEMKKIKSIKVVCVFIYLLYKYGWNYVWKKKFEMHFSISRLRFLHFYHLVNVSFFINMQICRIQIRVACAAIHRCRFTFQFTVTRSFMRRINEG